MRKSGWILLLLVAGCATSKVVPTRYFAIEPELHNGHAGAITRGATAPAMSPEARLPETAPPPTLGVRPLMAAKPYSIRMAYRGPNHEIAYRNLEEWAEAPADAITRVLTDAIAATGAFEDVGNAADMARPDLILTGELRKFREDRTAETPTAEIEVRLELREARDVKSLWAATLSATRPLPDATAGGLAAAMNEATAQIAREAAASIAATVGATTFPAE